jgi:trans-2-enoyl-CoA reductase
MIISRTSCKRFFRFIPRRYYHELSYRVTGEPEHVLEYRREEDRHEMPSSDLVGVEMLYAPYNPADVNSIQGKYPNPDDITTRQSLYNPHYTVAGSEGLARVVHVGADANLSQGDIVTVGQSGFGTMRSLFWAKPNSMIALDRGEELIQRLGPAASVLPQIGGTAFRLLCDFETRGLVVQNAGNSAVGFMASQLARTMGRSVISLVRKGKKSEQEWKELEDHLTIYGKAYMVLAEEDVASKEGLKNFHESLTKEPPLLALNSVGGESASILSKMLNPGGSMITYGGMSKQPVTVGTPHFIFKDLRYFGYWHSRWMSTHTYQEKKEMLDLLIDKVLVQKGGIACPPVEVFPLSSFQEAIKFDACQSGIRKKIVFDCQDD